MCFPGKRQKNLLSDSSTKPAAQPSAKPEPAAAPVAASTVPASAQSAPVETTAPAPAEPTTTTTTEVKPADMSAPRIAVVVYSMYGHIGKLAESIKAGITEAGGSASILQIAETLPQEVLAKMHAPPKPDYPILEPKDLVNYDAFLFGIPTRYGNFPAQWKAFWDATGGLWAQGSLAGKYASVFISTGTLGGGQESTALASMSTFAHHGIIYVPLGYSTTFDILSNLSEVHGGSPWGAGTFAGADGSRLPSPLELELASRQGKYFFSTTEKKMSFAGTSAANAATGGQGQGGHHDASVTLDHILEDITTTQDPKALSDKLKHFTPREARDTILASTLSSGQDPLSVLDPATNTIGYLYILAARLSVQASQMPSLRVIEEFCSGFNPEYARHAPERMTALARGIVRVADSSNKPKYAVGPLYDLVTRYPPSLSYLTTLHPLFISVSPSRSPYWNDVSQCLRYPRPALPVLSVPILDIDTSLSDLHYNDNLIYHYAGGIALGALKMWREAEEFFEVCVSAPAQVPAAIQMEALKKLTLVQLILYGKPNPVPKYTNQVLSRLFKQSPYGRLAEAYPKSLPELQALDQNMGLIQQVLECAPRWLIRKATQTYLTLGMTDIAKETGNPSVDQNRAIVLSMIDNGEINATLSVDDTVTFSDSASNVTKSDIDKALKNAQQQSVLLLELERELAQSKEYLAKALKYKDEASYGPEDDAGFGLHGHGGGGGGPWAEESMFGM
ncbi:hypothetical protein EIP91_004668 [Steccherinum ochraceum]|uniref:Flavodoxin-like domain-containing protein n=1 Tax=Steccherinum ochraceum TaxID=92696 RepID=A0A4R0RNV2_9APHY|nr:hypothetical protein EIP91_004668 [Steccherinum ochraceum]